MSYSVCLNCKEMVGSYEKYCTDCEDVLNVENTKLFWKNFDYSKKLDSDFINNEISKDRKVGAKCSYSV